jgi:hypothetical protein
MNQIQLRTNVQNLVQNPSCFVSSFVGTFSSIEFFIIYFPSYIFSVKSMCIKPNKKTNKHSYTKYLFYFLIVPL